MRELFVPVSGRFDQKCSIAADDLRAMGASRVYIAIEERFPFERGERRERVLTDLRDKVEYYTREGFEVGVWIDTLGYGGEMPSYNAHAAKKYTRIRSIVGLEQDDALCPLDPDFSAMMCELVADIVRVSGTRMLMLDDELCLSVRPGIGCACERHLSALSSRLGERIELSDVGRLAFSGEPNKYRSAWLSLMRDTLADFAAKIRSAVDQVDPDVRIGFCSGYTSWDLEGLDAMELSRILAGKNKPFLRFTGAPYWISSRRFDRQSLQCVIESTRMQEALCRDSGIEVFTEADTYPRDRFNTPAAFSECFDIATRHILGMDALKYVYEYSNQPSYERGYVDAHLRGKALYSALADAFSGKTPIGVRVYESIRKIETAALPKVEDRAFNERDEIRIENLMFSPAAAMLSENAIPTVYEGEGIFGISFGEGARAIDVSNMPRALVLDAKAAQILTDRGIDVGLRSLEYMTGTFLERDERGEDVLLFNAPTVAKMEIDGAAECLSRYLRFELYSDESYPAAYRYENTSGERFLVFGFDAEAQPAHSSLIRSYIHADMIRRFAEYAHSPLAAVCAGHPMLYSIVCEGDCGMSVAYINIHPDSIVGARVELSRAAAAVAFIGCEGRMISEREIEISRIEPYATAAIEISYDFD